MLNFTFHSADLHTYLADTQKKKKKDGDIFFRFLFRKNISYAFHWDEINVTCLTFYEVNIFNFYLESPVKSGGRGVWVSSAGRWLWGLD